MKNETGGGKLSKNCTALPTSLQNLDPIVERKESILREWSLKLRANHENHFSFWTRVPDG
jgi:hypothetical protein